MKKKEAGNIKRFFGAVTDNHKERRNFKILITRDVFFTLHNILIALPIIQAFLISYGVTEPQLGTANFAVNIAMLISVIVFLGRLDKLDSVKVIRTNMNAQYLVLLFPAVLLIMDVTGDRIDPSLLFIIITGAWALAGFFAIFRLMIDTRVNQNMFRSSIFGYVYGIDGIIFNLAGVIGSFLMRPLLERNYGNMSGFGISFIIALCMVPAIVFLSGKFTLIREPATNTDLNSTLPFKYFKKAYSNKNLKYNMLLHIIRGLMNGVAIFMLPIGIRYFDMPLSYAAYMVMIGSFTGIIGYVFIALFYDRAGTVKAVWLSSAIISFAAVGLIFINSPVVFLIMLAFITLGLTIISISVPIGTFKITPDNFISTFTGIRTFLMQTMEAAAALMLGLFMSALPIYIIVSFILILMVIQVVLAVLAFKDEDVIQ